MEPSADGVGAKALVGDIMIKGRVCVPLASRAKAKAKAKAREIVATADRQKLSKRMSLPAKKKSKGAGFQGHCYNCGEKGIPRGSARKARNDDSRKKKGTVTKEKVQDGVVEQASGKSTEKSLKETGSGSSQKRKKACWQHRVGWKGEGARRRRRLRSGPVTKTKDIRATHTGDLRRGRR